MESSTSSAKKEEAKEVVLDIPTTEDEERETISRRPSVDISVDSLCYSDADDSWHTPYVSNGGNFGDEDYSDISDLEADLEAAAATTNSQPASVSLKKEATEVIIEKAAEQPKLSISENNASSNQVIQLVRNASKNEKECRICHLGLETTQEAGGSSIVLGCSCKDDLALAHKHCAEAWFKIRGNRICEICGSTARNVVGIEDVDFMDQWNDANAAPVANTDSRNFWRGHRFLNFLLACMVFAFVISWLFHFNIPS